jgi:hypothetical protein
MTLKTTQDDATRLSARLVEIAPEPESMAIGGEPVEVGMRHFEVTAKPRKGSPEVTRVFRDRGDAETAYELACLGVTDLSTPLLDLPREFWKGKRELADQVLHVPGFDAGVPGPVRHRPCPVDGCWCKEPLAATEESHV